MTSNSAESGTAPIREVLGLSSGQAVRSRVNGLIVHRLSKDTPSARALRAQLRSALGKETGSIPAIWDLTLDDESQYLGNNPTRGEKAVHGALTLWARHQGSNKRQMHDVSDHPRRFASAIRVVAEKQRGEKQRGEKRVEETPIYRSFSAAIQAPTYEGLLVRLRSLVSQLEAAEVPCDYGYLASDLFYWQDPSRRTSVVRNWGRQFARTTQTASQSAQ